MISNLITRLLEYKKRKYMAWLIQRGLKIGRNSYVLDGAFLDPSHCFLISIGDHCTLAPNVRLIAHDASMVRHLKVARLGRIKIQDNCFIGDSTVVLPGVSIGPNAIVGAGSVVTRDVPPNSVAAGNPARVIMSLDEFLSKHAENAKSGRRFPIERFEIDAISDKDKQEMISYLDKNIGYMTSRFK